MEILVFMVAVVVLVFGVRVLAKRSIGLGCLVVCAVAALMLAQWVLLVHLLG